MTRKHNRICTVRTSICRIEAPKRSILLPLQYQAIVCLVPAICFSLLCRFLLALSLRPKILLALSLIARESTRYEHHMVDGWIPIFRNGAYISHFYIRKFPAHIAHERHLLLLGVLSLSRFLTAITLFRLLFPDSQQAVQSPECLSIPFDLRRLQCR